MSCGVSDGDDDKVDEFQNVCEYCTYLFKCELSVDRFNKKVAP